MVEYNSKAYKAIVYIIELYSECCCERRFTKPASGVGIDATSGYGPVISERVVSAFTEPILELSGPIFDRITIHLDIDYHDGDLFVIATTNNDIGDRYIQRSGLTRLPLNA